MCMGAEAVGIHHLSYKYFSPVISTRKQVGYSAFCMGAQMFCHIFCESRLPVLMAYRKTGRVLRPAQFLCNSIKESLECSYSGF